jgi:uncharacterized protein involved in outer membrane biogenesis
LPLGLLHGWEGDLQLSAEQIAIGDAPALHRATGRLVVSDGRLRMDGLSAQLGGGKLSGNLGFDATVAPPSLVIEAEASDATITGPLDDAPVELESGRANAGLRLAAAGYSPAALLATLNGRATLSVRDGLVSGFDLLRLKQAVEKAEPNAGQTAAEEALRSGVTPFDRLELDVGIAHGDAVLGTATLNGPAGTAQATGNLGLPSQTLDLRIALRPAVPNPPEIALHLAGPIGHPSRTSELAELARWMASLVR